MRRRASQAAGFVAMLIAAGVLISGWAGLPLLSSWGASCPPIAVVAVAVGVGLILFNVDPGIDPWLASGTATEGVGPASFRVAKVGGLALGLAGGALALSRFERHRLAATMLGGIAGAFAVFAMLGYLAGIDMLYGSASVSSPSLPGTIGLLCIAGAIILRVGTMPALRKSRPLWHLLVLLGCAIVAPLLLFGAYAGFRIADAQLRDVREDLTIEARTLSAEADREIIGEIERLRALAASPSLREGDFAAFQRQAEEALALRQSGNIVLIDRNMQQLVNTSVPFGTRLGKAAASESAKRALATGRPRVTGLFMRPVTHRLNARHHRARTDRWREPLRPRQGAGSAHPGAPRRRT